jgi:hypothetical protein
MVKLVKDVIRALLGRLEIPEEETAAVTGYIDTEEYRSMFDELVKGL